MSATTKCSCPSRTTSPATEFTIEVREGERALDVFNHPYAYAAWHGVELNAEPRRRLAVRGGVA